MKYSIKLRENQVKFLLSEIEEIECISKKMRKLYGIVGIDALWTPWQGEWRVNYLGFFLPQDHERLLNDAKNTGWFEKEIQEQDLDVLKYIYDRNAELRQRYSMYWTPRFWDKQVARALNITQEHAQDCLERLVGLLCRVKISSDTSMDNRQYYLFPSSHIELVQEIFYPAHHPDQLTFWEMNLPHYKERFRIENTWDSNQLTFWDMTPKYYCKRFKVK